MPDLIEDIPLERLTRPLIDRHRTDAQIKAMAGSLERHGQINEIIVTPDPEQEGGYIVVAGWTRKLAAETLP